MERKTNYPLSLLLSTFSMILPFLGVMFAMYEYGKEYQTLAIIVMGICILQYFLLKLPLQNMRNKAIQDNEYDEFGMSKKKNYQNLSRKEREEMDLQKTAQIESLISSSVIKKITKKGSTNPEEDLDNLIGINSVKEKTEEMVARMKFEQDTKRDRKRKGLENSSMSGRHMVFYGSAGTGKTSMARILTGFLYKYGYIKENKLIEVDGNFLKAGEDSSLKTKLIIQKAYGGVLFIDEAYTIIDGSGGYGREAVATLIKEMEDNRDRLIIILAGYKNDMKRLLDSNEGFKSRIKEYIDFPNYNVSEMSMIFEKMANNEGFVVSAEAKDNFEIRCAKEMKLSSFGNGRTARNILDEAIDRHAVNYGKELLTKDEKFILCGVDINTSANTKVL